MEFIKLDTENAKIAYRLFQDAIDKKEMLYKSCTLERFIDIFLNASDKEQTNINLIEADGKAFASGCFVNTGERAYITMVLVDGRNSRQGYGRAILKELEKRLICKGKIKTFEIVFFNPVTLEWKIPWENACYHPNAPGVDMSSSAYLFFKNCGYRDFAVQNSYYRNLQKYQMSESVQQREIELKSKDITFTIYEEKNHYGMEEMIRRFQNPLWERDILGEIKDDGGRPILTAEHNGKVCAFAGPLDIQFGGRGYFAGIGVDEDYRGEGIAKVLFQCLCKYLGEMGAEYMTLFTGENNPARNIYEMTGFKIVRSWADMRKKAEDIL